MVKTSENGSSRNIFIIEDLPKIKQVIKQIQLGISSQQKAAVQFNVMRGDYTIVGAKSRQ